MTYKEGLEELIIALKKGNPIKTLKYLHCKKENACTAEYAYGGQEGDKLKQLKKNHKNKQQNTLKPRKPLMLQKVNSSKEHPDQNGKTSQPLERFDVQL